MKFSLIWIFNLRIVLLSNQFYSCSFLFEFKLDIFDKHSIYDKIYLFWYIS